MAERWCIIEKGDRFFDVETLVPSPKLSKHLEDVGADTWVPNPKISAPSSVPPHKTRSKKRQITQDIYPVWGNVLYHAFLMILVSTSLGRYGMFSEVADEKLSTRIAKLQWHKFSTAILNKSGVAITGFGTVLVYGEEVLIPLYIEGEETGPCRLLLKIPLIETCLQYPYDSLIDRTWSTVAHMRFLQEKTTIPVSHVYYFYLEGVDILGGNCPWMIQERLPGTPLHQDIGALSASQIQFIGYQWGNQLAAIHSLRFSSAGALRTTAKGERVVIQTVGADPDGNHLIADHYSSPVRTSNGIMSTPRDKPIAAVEYLFSLANTALVRLMTGLGRRLDEKTPEEREEFLWGCVAYIYLRHLHLFIPQYAVSHLVESYFVLDLPSIDLGNIHIDDKGNICGIVSCDGMNIVPSHMVLRLPQLLQGYKSISRDDTKAKTRNRQRFTFLQETVACGFWTGLPKYVTLKPGKTLKGMELNDVWAAGSKAKSFERLLYRFTGNNDDESPEFRAYLVYARETWEGLFKSSSTGYSDTSQLTQFIKRNWITLTGYYPRLCFNPPIPVHLSSPIPRRMKSMAPASSRFSGFHSIAPAPGPRRSRLRRTRSEGAKPESPSHKREQPNKIGSYLVGVTDKCLAQFVSFSKRIRGEGRRSV